MTFPTPALHHRSTWSLDTLSGAELLGLIDTAHRLKADRRAGVLSAPLRGKRLALLGHGPRDDLLRRAATGMGAEVTSLPDVAAGDLAESRRLLGKLYDAVDCQAPSSALDVERDAGIPVFNGLGEDAHPARTLAALAAIQEAAGRPLAGLRLALVGRAECPCGHALAQAAARIGFELHAVTDAAAAADADFVLDIRDPARWALTDRQGPVHEGECDDDRGFALQALLVSTLG